MAHVGFPELEDAYARWRKATGQLPGQFQTELLDALTAVEDGMLTLGCSSVDPRRSHNAFDHAIADAYDRVMHYESMALGLPGPEIQLPPICGAILRREFGPLNQTEAEPAEIALLRAWLTFVSSAEPPTPEPD
jgi:hypothetical protein